MILIFDCFIDMEQKKQTFKEFVLVIVVEYILRIVYYLQSWSLISNKHGIHELPDKLPKDLRLRILGNQEILRKFRILVEL